jgi:hypothetical protein
MIANYRNTIVGDIIDNLTGKTAREKEAQRIALLQSLSEKSTTNPLIYIIPIGAVIIFGVILVIALKKKK